MRYFTFLDPLWTLDYYKGCSEDHRQSAASIFVGKIVSELNSVALRQLSKVHRDELIKRSHQCGADLTGYSFFLDIQQSSSGGQASMAQKSMSGGNVVSQRIGQHLRRQVEKKDSKNFVAMTRFKYARGLTNYIVVERDFLDKDRAGRQLTRCAGQYEALGRRLPEDAWRFYEGLDLNSKSISTRGTEYLSQEPLCAFIVDKTYCMFMSICN